MRRALVRESFDAESLLSRLAAGERFGQAPLLNLLRELADRLDDAHRRGAIHGTITPADVVFDEAGEASLTGFGRDTTPDPMRKSPYAPVELYAPVHPQGPWTDIYSLAAVLWHAVTGEAPAEVLVRKGETTLERLEPSGFDPLFLRAVDAALEIAPQRRPQTLEAWLGLFPVAPAATGARPEPASIAPPVEPGSVEVATATAAEPALRLQGFERYAAGAALAVFSMAALLVAPIDDPAPRVAVPPPSVESRPPAAVPRPVPRTSAPATVAVPVPAAAPPPAPVTQLPSPPPKVEAEPVTRETKAAAPPPRATEPPRQARAPAPEIVPPPVIDDPPADVRAASPRELLARSDRMLRDLFRDYDRLRADVRRSYRNDDVPQRVKERAYDESLRIHDDLLRLRSQRNRLARTDGVDAAQRRYWEIEKSAARIDARMDDLRRSI